MRSHPAYLLLAMLGETLDGIEAQRKAAQNRYRAFTAEKKSEHDSAKGLIDTREALVLKAVLDDMVAAENHVIRELRSTARSLPLCEGFVESRKGVDYKGIGRLLGVIGDPLWNSADDRQRRGPAELWAYCGYHTIPAGDHALVGVQASNVSGGNVRPRRQHGIKCNWNVRAKTIAYTVAESAYRQGDYRPIYLRERDKAATKTHVAECRNRVRPPGRSNGCGTVSNPEWGEPGSLWRPGHQHQHSVSMVAKRILQDLFVEGLAA